jgi:uncharacterized protein YbaA (DUF1428 family)
MMLPLPFGLCDLAYAFCRIVFAISQEYCEVDCKHPSDTIMKLSKVQIITVAIAAMVGSFASSVLALDDRTDLLQIDAKNFSRPTIIDNKYMPLKPGSQVVYEGWTLDDEDKRVSHKVIDVVTDLVKEINGIETVVVWERDIKNGKLEESELAFRAQDDKGNVWHFGEVTEVYDENIKLIGAKVWMDGRLGAKSGIIMPAKPAVGTPSFSQGFASGVYKWDDRGQVRKVGEKVTVPAGAFKDVTVIEEWSSGERKKGALQLKYYAPSIGYVKVGFEGNDPVKETLELTKVSQLNAKEMDDARAEALMVEERSFYYGRDTKPPRRR